MPDPLHSATTRRYAVGIDLGTTNTALAYAELTQDPIIQAFPIDQLVALGQIAPLPLLPSVRYHPAPDEISGEDVHLPWKPTAPSSAAVIGQLGKMLGTKSPTRLVASAKSWLCHSNVDRFAPILPWSAPDDVEKISPVAASASFLAYLRDCWNYRFPAHPLEAQDVYITVPASFDVTARELTLEAARMAGLSEIRLLEEPQAACYAWLWQQQQANRQDPILSAIKLMLVVDIGGGTTDFSLIATNTNGQESIAFKRIAVGNHLLLGGDNIDLALAHIVEEKVNAARERLSGGELAALLQQCRLAKEALLSKDPPDSFPITLLGRGRQLIGGSRTTRLDREEVQSLVLDGFFPTTPLKDFPSLKKAAIVEFGLPYASEPAFSRHIAQFLHDHRQSIGNALGSDMDSVPDTVVLNGGIFASPLISERLRQILADWKSGPVRVVTHENPSLSVALGAVSHALANNGLAQRLIASDSPRSYFLLTGKDSAQSNAVCLLPKGTPAGKEIVLTEHQFALKLGLPVAFQLYSTAQDGEFSPGQIIAIDPDLFFPLPPLTAALAAEDQKTPSEIAVRIAAAMSELGDLHVDCISVANREERWHLRFQIRANPSVQTPERISVSSNTQAQPARELISKVFGKKDKAVDPQAIKTLRNDLERLLGKRETWDVRLSRDLFDALMEGSQFRRRSTDHERVWLNLAGFCIRPGLGVDLDDWRISQLWPLYTQGLQFLNETRTWSEWWTLWRRAAGGLNLDQQQTLLDDLRTFVDPSLYKKGNTPTLAKKRSLDDMIRLLGSLEHLPSKTKIVLGDWLLGRLDKEPSLEVAWWALGRIGARVPLYGHFNSVVPADVAETWLNRIGSHFGWKNQRSIAMAATVIARMSGDRARDISDSCRQATLQHLRNAKATDSWVQLVEQVQQLEQSDEGQLLGDSLPPGLTIMAPRE